MSSYNTVSSSTRRGLPLLGLVAMLLLVGCVGLPARLAHLGSRSSHHAHQPAWVERAARLNVRHGCSHTGLDPGAIPAHTVVKVGRHVRLASFDEGWAMHLHQRPGMLISVCAR